MKNLFEEINELSVSINGRIQDSGIQFEDDYIGDRNREIIEIELEEDEKSVLILGVNPSITVEKGELKYPNINFLKAIKGKNIPDQYKGYTHDYHQQRYNYFFDDFSMMWEKETYLHRYVEEYASIEDKEFRIVDKEKFIEGLQPYRNHSKNYVLFADILHFKATDSVKIQPFFEDKKALDQLIKKQGGESRLSEEEFSVLQDDIFKLFELQLEYYKPEMVWINFKRLTSFLEKYFKVQGISIEPIYQRIPIYKGEPKAPIDTIFKAEYKGIKIYFSNFLTAGGMTTKEKQFLKQEMDQDLIKLGFRER